MKEYKLIKDMPNLSAGAIFKFNEKTTKYDCVYAPKEQKTDWSFTKELVEVNPEWFEEIKNG